MASGWQVVWAFSYVLFLLGVFLVLIGRAYANPKRAYLSLWIGIFVFVYAIPGWLFGWR